MHTISNNLVRFVFVLSLTRRVWASLLGDNPSVGGLASSFLVSEQTDQAAFSQECRQAQKYFFASNPALLKAMETFQKNAKKEIENCFDESYCNVNVQSVAGYNDVKTECAKANGDLHYVHQFVACGTKEKSLQIRNDITCAIPVCTDNDMKKDNLQVMKILTQGCADKLGVDAKQCGGSFTTQKAYKWFMHTPIAFWVSFTALCFYVAQKQKGGGYSRLSVNGK